MVIAHPATQVADNGSHNAHNGFFIMKLVYVDKRFQQVRGRS